MIKKYKLDKEEQELLEEFERGEWVRVEDFEQEKKKLEEAARNTLKKTRNINIRLTEMDLQRLKVKAAEEGIPYQTLASSILHKYTQK